TDPHELSDKCLQFYGLVCAFPVIVTGQTSHSLFFCVLRYLYAASATLNSICTKLFYKIIFRVTVVQEGNRTGTDDVFVYVFMLVKFDVVKGLRTV
ncbi:hypothetical protein L9F63_008015, partial [Diploptera punctata]